jgi:hypothetical protein
MTTFTPINTTSKFGQPVLSLKQQLFGVLQNAYNYGQLAVNMTDFVGPGTSAGGGTAVTAASWSGSVATFTVANSFVPGQVVVVGGMTPNGYNGVYTVVSASSTQFTAALASNPGTATGFGYAGPVSWTNVETYFGVSTGQGLAFYLLLMGIGNTTAATYSGNPTGAPLGALYAAGSLNFVNNIG